MTGSWSSWSHAEATPHRTVPVLKELLMGSCGCGSGNSHVLFELSKISWGQLPSVNLCYNGLHDDDAMEVLAKALWHKLTALRLDGNKIWGVGWLHLRGCTWPLQELYLCRMPFGELAFAFLKSANWPNLTKVDLSYSTNSVDMTARAVAHLNQGDWPLLSWLCLSGNRICDADVLGELVKGRWPLLKALQLADNELPPHGATCLSQSSWPILEELSIGFTTIDKTVGGNLTKGNWPDLNKSTISCGIRHWASGKGVFDVRAECVDMCKSKWPDVNLSVRQNAYPDLMSG